MPLMNAQQYEHSLRQLRLNVYLFGERVETPVDHPMIRPSMQAVGVTYDLAHRPEFADLMTATSHLTGQTVNRFTHIHRSVDDLVKKSKMGRLLGRTTGCCFQRCVGMDALNALSIVTYNVDQQRGTSYNQRFLKYLEYVQEHDLTCDGAMTDPKGDRSPAAAPAARPRCVPARGRGAAGRHRGARREGPPDRRGQLPRDHRHAHPVAARGGPGLCRVVRRAQRHARASSTSWAASPATRAGWRRAAWTWATSVYGGHEALVVFDDVFVPWERVFMYKEIEFAGQLVENFAAYHRQSYACKVGVGDVLIGAAQTIAEYNGVAKASHIKDKIVEMNHLNETLYCGCIACAAEGHREPGGTYMVDTLLANVHKQNVTRFPYEIARLAQDIAGGLMVTMPSEAGSRSRRKPASGWRSTCRASGDVPTENRMRILRLIENLTLGTAAVGYLTESMHGAGSPQAQRIMIARTVDMEEKKAAARRLSGIDE